MDETPIKAGKKSPGKLKQAYFWPMIGQAGEIVFPFSTGRSQAQLDRLLEGWSGETLLTDGYAAYARYAAQRQEYGPARFDFGHCQRDVARPARPWRVATRRSPGQ